MTLHEGRSPLHSELDDILRDIEPVVIRAEFAEQAEELPAELQEAPTETTAVSGQEQQAPAAIDPAPEAQATSKQNDVSDIQDPMAAYNEMQQQSETVDTQNTPRRTESPAFRKVYKVAPELLDYLDEDDLRFDEDTNSWFVTDRSKLEAATALYTYEQVPVPVDPTLVEYFKPGAVQYAESQVVGKEPTPVATQEYIDLALEQKVFEDGEKAKKQAEIDDRLENLRAAAAEKVNELKDKYLTSEVITRGMLDDPDYQHPSAQILDHRYKVKLAIRLEKAFGLGDDSEFLQQFITDHLDEVKAAIMSDRERMRSVGKNPDADYAEPPLQLMRLDPDLLPTYLYELLGSVQHGLTVTNFEAAQQAYKQQVAAPVGGVATGWLGKLKRQKNTQMAVDPNETRLHGVLDGMQRRVDTYAHAQEQANITLKKKLQEIQASLERKGLESGQEDAINPENNPLLLETDFIESFKSLTEFMAKEEFRSFLTDSNGDIEFCLLKGFADKAIHDAIDELGRRMDQTRGPIPLKVPLTPGAVALAAATEMKLDLTRPLSQQFSLQAEEVQRGPKHKLGFVGLIRSRPTDKNLQGAFLVEYWINKGEYLLEGATERDAIVHVFHLTPNTTLDVMESYVRFYAPDGRETTGNLDSEVPDAMNRIQQTYMGGKVGDFATEQRVIREEKAAMRFAEIDLHEIEELTTGTQPGITQQNTTSTKKALPTSNGHNGHGHGPIDV